MLDAPAHIAYSLSSIGRGDAGRAHAGCTPSVEFGNGRRDLVEFGVDARIGGTYIGTLDVMHAARYYSTVTTRIEDMRVPPGNRLEALSKDRAGQWSVRINDQFRLCFRWDDGGHDVEIVDYH